MGTSPADIKKYINKSNKESIYAIYYDGMNGGQIISHIRDYCHSNYGCLTVCTNEEGTKLFRLSNQNTSLPIIHEIKKNVYFVLCTDRNNNVSNFLVDIISKEVFEKAYIELTEYIKMIKEKENTAPSKQETKEKIVEKQHQKSTTSRCSFKLYEDGKPVIEYEGDTFPDDETFKIMFGDKISKHFPNFYENKKNKRIILS
jgi:hypothetical protein